MANPFDSYYRKKYNHKLGDFRISENWGSGTLTIPLYPDISEAEQEYVIDFLIKILSMVFGLKFDVNPAEKIYKIYLN